MIYSDSHLPFHMAGPGETGAGQAAGAATPQPYNPVTGNTPGDKQLLDWPHMPTLN